MGRIVHPRGKARLSANLTPMIDLTFLLIVFFILVSQITDRERVPVSLPSPSDPASAPATDPRRTVINIVARDDAPAMIAAVLAGGVAFQPDGDGSARLAAHLASLYRTAPQMRLSVRADRRLQYRYVEPVLRAIAEGAMEAGVPPRVNLVVIREGGAS